MLGAKETKKKLKRIVQEKGWEYVYEAPYYEDEYGEEVQGDECYYSDPAGNPSCLVGTLLKQEYPKFFEELRAQEWENGYTPEVIPISEIALDDYFTPEAQALLKKAQRMQDDSVSWGEVIEAMK